MGRDSRGRRTHESGRRGLNRRNGRARQPASHVQHFNDDFGDLLGRFSDALSLITVVHRSLSARESGPIGDEEVALGRAIDELKAVYNELDASTAFIRSAAARRFGARQSEEREQRARKPARERRTSG